MEDSAALKKAMQKELKQAKRYNISLEQLRFMKSEQRYRCAICGIHEVNLVKGLFVDHCHETGEVRGLLCIRCNHGIGNFRDNVRLLEEAVNYLK